MDFIKSKRLKILGASALTFILALVASFLLPTSDVDANAKSKRTQTTVMAKQKTPESTQAPSKKKNAKEKADQAQEAPTSNQPPAKPKSVEERLKEDLERAREADRQNKDVEAFRTANAVANSIARNKLDQTGENAETFKKYYQDAVEIAKTSGERLQKKNNDRDKTLFFVF